MKYEADATYFSDTSAGNPLLGCGGCFTRVERCCNTETKAKVAIKSMDHLLDNEVDALLCTNFHEVPRVTRFIDQGMSASGDRCLVFELVEGYALRYGRLHGSSGMTAEEQMLAVASQMVHTLNHMHLDSRVCHGDITPGNIMLQSTPASPWDAVRLIDFGFAADFNPGNTVVIDGMNLKITDVRPAGATTAYASPEQLRSLQAQFEGHKDHEDILINGPASDTFSLGVVLYEMLTGELPFVVRKEHIEEGLTPDSVPEQFVETWDEYDAMLRVQDDWEDAVLSAKRMAEKAQQPTNVDHPLLDKVRACSANPDIAADFFLWMLSPIHTWRFSADAGFHPYLEPTYLRMLDEFPLPESHPCKEIILKERTDDGSCVKTDKKAGSSVPQTTKDEDSNAACQCSQASTSAPEHQSKTEHAQLPQQMQEHGPLQQAQHAQQIQHAEKAQHVQDAQLPPQLQEHQHAPKACGLSAFVKIGRKNKSRSCTSAAVSQAAGASGKASQAAAVGGSPADVLPHRNGKQRAMQKLKALVKKIRPSCMQACTCGTGMQSDQQQEDVSVQGLSSSDRVNDSRHVQLVAAAVDVEAVNVKKQVMARASGETPCFSRLRGLRIFGEKMTVSRSSEQPLCEQLRGSGAESEQESAALCEAGSLIAAMQAPCDVEPQAKVDNKSIAVGGQQAYQSKKGVKQKLASLLSSSRQRSRSLPS